MCIKKKKIDLVENRYCVNTRLLIQCFSSVIFLIIIEIPKNPIQNNTTLNDTATNRKNQKTHNRKIDTF